MSFETLDKSFKATQCKREENAGWVELVRTCFRGDSRIAGVVKGTENGPGQTGGGRVNDDKIFTERVQNGQY